MDLTLFTPNLVGTNKMKKQNYKGYVIKEEQGMMFSGTPTKAFYPQKNIIRACTEKQLKVMIDHKTKQKHRERKNIKLWD